MKIYKNLKQATLEKDNVQALKISIKEESFPEEILEFYSLEELYLEGHCEHFPRLLSHWPKLKLLSIKWPNFTGDLSTLFSLPILENLKIIDTPLKTFFLPLGHAKAPIRSLTIKDCQLTHLPEEISILDTLHDLNLSGNKLDTLPHGFKALSHLKRLNLDSNQFHIFPEILKKLPKLSHLSLDGNLFSQEEKERIQREFNLWIS